jgi:hypothetical protein
MSDAFRLVVYVLALTLMLGSPSLSQSHAVPTSQTSPAINDLATALVRATSEGEQDRLLAQKKDLINASLLSALRDAVRSFDRKRQAALKLMKNPETSHPFYWAGFVLVGDGR